MRTRKRQTQKSRILVEAGHPEYWDHGYVDPDLRQIRFSQWWAQQHDHSLREMVQACYDVVFEGCHVPSNLRIKVQFDTNVRDLGSCKFLRFQPGSNTKPRWDSFRIRCRIPMMPRYLKPGLLISTLIHEFQHVRQYVEGRLVDEWLGRGKHRVIWRGQPYEGRERWEDYPWEQEAVKAEADLAPGVSHQLGFRPTRVRHSEVLDDRIVALHTEQVVALNRKIDEKEKKIAAAA